MMKTFFAIMAVAVSVMLSACGGSESFRINGEVEGMGTRSLKFYYYDGDRLKTGMATALDGKFQYEGRASSPVLISVSTNQGTPIGHLVAENGDAITVKFFSSKPMLMEVSGNQASEKYASFIKDNYDLVAAGTSDSLDMVIEKFVSDNPKNLASAVTMALHYNLREKSLRADSLLNTLDAKARPSQVTAGFTAMMGRQAADTIKVIEPFRLYNTADSMTTVDPAKYDATLILFYDNRSFFTEAVRDSLRKIDAGKKPEVAILNVSLAADTAAWKKPLSQTDVKGKELWIPGSVSAPSLQQFSLETVPTVVLLDSLGTVIYKGDSFDNALKNLRRSCL
ncbi:MAG: DUF4369 domain-containing protein [Barnesiella sp.]|nr:DUF4369 domain-containing protein [Barnesiella sp.]